MNGGVYNYKVRFKLQGGSEDIAETREAQVGATRTEVTGDV